MWQGGRDTCICCFFPTSRPPLPSPLPLPLSTAPCASLSAADLALKGVPSFAGLGISRNTGIGDIVSVLPYTDIDLTSRQGAEDVTTMETLGSAPGFRSLRATRSPARRASNTSRRRHGRSARWRFARRTGGGLGRRGGHGRCAAGMGGVAACESQCRRQRMSALRLASEARI